MYRLLESIRCEKGELQNLRYHQARMDDSVKELFSADNSIKLEKIPVPEYCQRGLYKCRLVYGKKIESLDFLPYQHTDIHSLKIVNANEILYSHKFADRSIFHQLLEKKENCDDILIVKNGLVTDISYANILFFNGKNWLTPTLPLLKGTQREKLLSEEKIITADIRPSDIPNFQKAQLINAMIRFEDEVDVEINNIFN